MTWPTTWQDFGSLATTVLAALALFISIGNLVTSRLAQRSKSNLEQSDFALNLKRITDETVDELLKERAERQRDNVRHQAKIARLEARVKDLEDLVRANDKMNMELWVEGSPIMATIRMQQKYKDHWREKNDWYWFWKLAQEFLALGWNVAGFHRDGSPRWELMQIASICMNWMQLHEARKAAEADDTVPIKKPRI